MLQTAFPTLNSLDPFADMRRMQGTMNRLLSMVRARPVNPRPTRLSISGPAKTAS